MIIFNRFFIFLGSGLVGCAHGTDGTKPNRYPTGLKKPVGVRWDAKANALAQLACQEQKPTYQPRIEFDTKSTNLTTVCSCFAQNQAGPR